MSVKQRGSMTVFAALAFMLVASFLFALLELARVQSLAMLAEQKSAFCLEAVCTEYQPMLWEEYHLLGLDGAFGGTEFSMEQVSDELTNRIYANLEREGDGGNILAMDLQEVQPVSYQVLTDGDGTVFLQCVTGYMKNHLSYAVAQRLYERYQENDEVEAKRSGEDCIQNAQDTLTAAREAQAEEEETKENSVENTQTVNEKAEGEQTEDYQTEDTEEDIENPIELVLALKQNAVLGMVTEVDTLSAKEIDLTNSIENRKCNQGTEVSEEKVEWYEKTLAAEYLDMFFSDYTAQKKEHALSYELEYVLGGAASDRANLETVVARLLLVREAANVAHILGDPNKMEATMETAGVLAGFSGNPAVVKVVQIGIVAAWAYMESVLDVRALLQGDAIALIKNQQQWTTELGNLLQAFEGSTKAINCPKGLSYQEYLKAFLLTMNQKKLAFRMMDIMEQNVRFLYDQKNFRMDHVIGRMSYDVTYQVSPLFYRLSVLGDGHLGEVNMSSSSQFSYY